MKYRVLQPEEKEILQRNGIDTDGVSVVYRDEKEIVILRHKTRDTISVRMGDKQW